jgi:hypothetical protein
MMCQDGIVNVSTTMPNTPNWWAKRSQNSVIFLHELLHYVHSNFYFWVILSYLTEFREREMPTSMTQKSGFKNAKCGIQPYFWLVGPFWARSTHFHDLTLKQSLFLIKFSTTLSKGAQSCKASRSHFWNGQTRVFPGPYIVNHHLEAPLGKMINMNIVPLSALSVVEVW